MSGALQVSVVVPAKDRAATLPRCLDSVLAQTLPPAEVLVVDDHSTDATREVLAAYAGRGVKALPLLEGRGAQAARNLGIRQAQAPWIAFQDSDDTWLPHKLARQAEALTAAGADPFTVVHGDALRVDEASGRSWPHTVVPTEGDCHALLLQRPGPLFPALLTSKAALDDIGGLDDNCPSYQEWDTAIRLSRHCRFVHLHEPLFSWIWHGSETISKNPQRAVQGYRHVIERHRADILALNGPSCWRRLKIDAVALALRGGLWGEAAALLEGEPSHPSFALARLLARLHLGPRGVGRALHLLA